MKESKDIKILIACEESQVVCMAFRERGFDAYSCDLKPCSGGHPEWHFMMDMFCVFNGGYLQTQNGDHVNIDKWHFIGLHPVCTKMTLSGNRTYAKGKPKHNERIESVEWTISLFEHVTSICNYAYMENPMGSMNGNIRLPKPQIIQPYYFGDEFQKTTCLWLKGLPFLFHSDKTDLFCNEISHVGRGEMWIAKSGKVMPKWFAESASTNNEKNRSLRSKTFPGIANAMAAQWGEYLTENL